MHLSAYTKNLTNVVEVKRCTSTVYSIITDQNRSQVMSEVANVLPGASINRTPSYRSSIGCIEWRGFTIVIKPYSKQGRRPAYAQNEDIVVSEINDALRNYNIKTLLLTTASGKEVTLNGVVEARSVGTDTKGRKKADVELVFEDGSTCGISIKMDNAGVWESACKYYREEGRLKLLDAIAEGIVTVTTDEYGISKISPNIAFKATDAQAMDVVFGNDLRDGGCVVRRTFNRDDFAVNGEVLTIMCTELLEPAEIADISKDVWFIIRNDSTRGEGILPGVKGLRVLAVPKHRITKTMAVKE